MDRTGDAELAALDAFGAATDASVTPDDVAAVLAYAEKLADRPAEQGAQPGRPVEAPRVAEAASLRSGERSVKNRITASGRPPWALDAA